MYTTKNKNKTQTNKKGQQKCFLQSLWHLERVNFAPYQNDFFILSLHYVIATGQIIAPLLKINVSIQKTKIITWHLLYSCKLYLHTKQACETCIHKSMQSHKLCGQATLAIFFLLFHHSNLLTL